ncbi:MAG: 6-phosphogluconolactonase, partial [Thermoplasmata archaeon]
MNPRVQRYPDLDAASRALASELLRRADGAVAARGRFTVVISGGRTPLPLYAHLAREYRSRFPWSRTEVFFADERCVPSRSPESNFGAAWDSFLSRVPVPRRQVHRIRGELRPPSEAATRYARLVVPVGPPGGPPGPAFDVVLLGIGPDGHTASLFPGQAAVRERTRSVVAVPRGGLAPFVPRISMTVPALSSAREVCFLVSGADKADAVGAIFRSGPRGDPRFPASCVRPPGP